MVNDGALSEEDCKKLKEKLKNRIQKVYATEIFKDEKAEQNDFHVVTYDRIIARALRLGPLKKYYLAAEKNIENDIKRGRGSESQKIADNAEEGDITPEPVFFLGKNEKGINSGWDLLLKLTAAYLIEDCRKKKEAGECLKNPSTRHAYRRVTWVDLINWSIRDGKIESDDLAALKYHDRPIFEKMTLDNVSKVRPVRPGTKCSYPGYLEYCGWHLLEEPELDQVMRDHPDWIIYEDQGAGEPLKKNLKGSGPVLSAYGRRV